jgi:prophage regulatory protein
MRSAEPHLTAADHHRKLMEGLATASRRAPIDERRRIEETKPRAIAPPDADEPPEPPSRVQRMYTEVQLLDVLPFGRSSLYKLLAQGAFPRPYYVLSGLRVWLENDVARWQQTLADREPIPHRRGGRRTKEPAK